ncbi:MAG TPA: DUF2161 family putative PD-(D/E)XK-type phosphodiesterase [Bacillota bacterium]|nr:DUF2161 family putative PD-(D/E)XK-type phosphodiesterase [Bacillota bacterium]HPL53288.1 DUF2161 family putative PD-(D/E)XK-type phosphodiesterase [Bacillota bacterium]
MTDSSVFLYTGYIILNTDKGDIMSSKNKDFKEEDLYRPIYDYLCDLGYTIRSEVSHCDIAAVKDQELLIVEMKKSLNLDVILQATLRQRFADTVYIAVPKPGKNLFSKRWKNLSYLLKRLQIGLMLVSLKKDLSFAEVAFEPVPFDMERSKGQGKKKRKELIKELNSRYGDFNSGGSTGKKLMTAYREMAVHIACCLIKHGPLNPGQLRDMGTDAKKTTTILWKNHYGWFKKISRGLYDISEKGKLEVIEHKVLYEYYISLADDKKSE